jgi:hypothetical protein
MTYHQKKGEAKAAPVKPPKSPPAKPPAKAPGNAPKPGPKPGPQKPHGPNPNILNHSLIDYLEYLSYFLLRKCVNGLNLLYGILADLYKINV